MQYDQFLITAFETKPSSWRAKIRRADGLPVVIRGPKKLEQFVTDTDSATAQAALLVAIAVIDAGTFSRTHAPSGRIFAKKFALLKAKRVGAK